MEVNIYEAKTNLSKLIQLLQQQTEESVNICKNGVPIVEMRLIKKPSKRVGVIKDDYDSMTLEEFNNIDISELFL